MAATTVVTPIVKEVATIGTVPSPPRLHITVSAKNSGDMYHARAVLAWNYLLAGASPVVELSATEMDQIKPLKPKFGFPDPQATCLISDKTDSKQMEAASYMEQLYTPPGEGTPKGNRKADEAGCTKILQSTADCFDQSRYLTISQKIVPLMYTKAGGIISQTVDAKIDRVIGACFPNPGNAVVILWRDTSRKPVHPYHDTGMETLEQLVKIVRDRGAIPGIIDIDRAELMQLTPPPSLTVANACVERAYFKNLDFSKLNVEEIESSKLTKRGYEAYFIQRAFTQNKLKMGVGLRSGALDLFTFLGIPTLSFVLPELRAGPPRKAVHGGERMLRLSGPKFKRNNVEYFTDRGNKGKAPNKGFDATVLSGPPGAKASDQRTDLAKVEEAITKALEKDFTQGTSWVCGDSQGGRANTTPEVAGNVAGKVAG